MRAGYLVSYCGIKQYKATLRNMSSSANKTISLYLVRHGQTTANRDKILQGSCDFPLTDVGLDEASRTGACLSKIHWDRILTSDLARAKNTCSLIVEKSNKDGQPSIESTSNLREVCFGVKEMLPKEITKAEARKIVAKREGIHIDKVVDTAESGDQVKKRQLAFIMDLRSTLPSNGTVIPCVLAISHGAFIRAFVRNFCENAEPERIGNCGISVFDVTFSNDSDDFSLMVHNDLHNVQRHMDDDEYFM